jgi:hypothetical protein
VAVAWCTNDFSRSLDRLDTALTKGFDRIYAHFDRVDARFDRMDARFDKMDERFCRLGSAMDILLQALAHPTPHPPALEQGCTQLLRPEGEGDVSMT